MAFITHTVINYSLLTINSFPIALRMFSRVTSGRMASSRGRLSGDIWTIREKPICWRHALSSTFPAISMTGMLAFFALFNTPAGTFPSAVCLSLFSGQNLRRPIAGRCPIANGLVGRWRMLRPILRLLRIPLPYLYYRRNHAR